MFRSRFFWKLFVSSAALVVGTTVGIGLLVLGPLERSFVDRLEVAMRAHCVYLGPLARNDFADQTPEELASRVATYRRETDHRITFILSTGEVIADSHEDPTGMESHSDREEVQEALTGGFGVALRPSRTVGRELLYVAHSPPEEGGPSGIVRVSIASDDIAERVAEIRDRITAVALLGVVLALGIGAFVARRITAPIAQMTQVAEALRDGNYDARVRDLPADELGVLGGALNRLGDEITERIAALTSGEARLRAMLAGMIEGVVAIDEDDRVLFSNEAARTLFDLDDSRGGQRLWEVVRIADLGGLTEEARRSDAPVVRELTFGHEGRETRLRASASRFQAEGRVGVLVVFDDVSELRRLESIRRDFVANVSHELKTPLTSIRGFVETLLDGALEDTDNNRRFLERIDDNVKRLNHLVTDLLSLARIEAEKGELPVNAVDWTGVVEDGLRRREEALREKGLAWGLESPGGAVQVQGDRESLTQVVDNLLDNAINYTPAGGRVTLALAEEDGWATLEVRDTGIGIPAADLERIFERFYRVDKARSRELGGTGLGLSIVKHLVLAMKGDVGVESTVGEGSTFRVRLPRAG